MIPPPPGPRRAPERINWRVAGRLRHRGDGPVIAGHAGTVDVVTELAGLLAALPKGTLVKLSVRAEPQEPR